MQTVSVPPAPVEVCVLDEESRGFEFSQGPLSLGRMYEKGDSVRQDVSMARTLYQKAASKGDGLAIKALRRLK